MDYPLDSDQIDQLILTLERAKFSDYSSDSSPILLLLEVAVDLMISLRRAYRPEEFSQRSHLFLNKDVKFDYDHADELGNPISFKKSVKFKNYTFFKKPVWDPSAEKVFEALATALIQIRRGVPANISIMESLSSTLDLPPNFSELNKNLSKHKEKKKFQQWTKVQRNSFFYYRRQSKRSKKTISNQKG